MNSILSSALVQMKQSISRSMFKFCIFANPIISAFLLGMIYRNKSTEDFMLYAFIGSGISTFWSSICYSSASDIEREKWIGTLPVLFTSPVGFINIILGKILGNTIWGLFSFSLSIGTVYFLFDIPLIFHNKYYFIIIFILMLFSMITIAFFMCSLFTLSRKISLIMNFIEYPFMIITGLFFPISILPTYIQYISYLFSPTWIMKGFKLSILGGDTREMISIVLFLLVITLIYLVIGIILFKKIEKLCCINATLEVF